MADQASRLSEATSGSAVPDWPSRESWSYSGTAAPTVSSSWQIRLAWSALPLLPFGFLLTGGSAVAAPLLGFFGFLTLLGCAWWWAQVWTRTAVPDPGMVEAEPPPD